MEFRLIWTALIVVAAGTTIVKGNRLLLPDYGDDWPLDRDPRAIDILGSGDIDEPLELANTLILIVILVGAAFVILCLLVVVLCLCVCYKCRSRRKGYNVSKRSYGVTTLQLVQDKPSDDDDVPAITPFTPEGMKREEKSPVHDEEEITLNTFGVASVTASTEPSETAKKSESSPKKDTDLAASATKAPEEKEDIKTKESKEALLPATEEKENVGDVTDQTKEVVKMKEKPSPDTTTKEPDADTSETVQGSTKSDDQPPSHSEATTSAEGEPKNTDQPSPSDSGVKATASSSGDEKSVAKPLGDDKSDEQAKDAKATAGAFSLIEKELEAALEGLQVTHL